MRLAATALILALSSSVAFAQSAPAAAPATNGTLELSATQAFSKGDYAKALPMLKTLSGTLKDQPDKAGMVAEQIRVCEKNLATPATQPAVAAVSPTAPPAAAPPAAAVAADRTPHPAPKPGEVLDMGIKDLGNFEFDVEAANPTIPTDVQALNGATIKLHGFMIPLDQAENISRFALVPSLFNCCYGQPPQIQHTIIVTCPKGKAVQYCSDEIIVEGKLAVGPIKDDGYITGIFAVETTSVKPAAK
jgi:hypothetical protein